MALNKMRAPAEEMPDEVYGSEAKRGSKVVKIVVALVVIFLVVGAVCSMVGVYGWGGDSIARPSSRDWQAVFLTNGQVYFGKVTDVGRKTLTLSDIYYLQVVTKPLQQTQQGEAASASTQTQQELTLIKLGNEIHGPQDRMTINIDQVLLTEKLKSDSRVVQAIVQYVADQQKK